MSEHQRRSLVRELRDEVARCADRDQLLVRSRQWLYRNQLVILHERAIRTLIAAALTQLEVETGAAIAARVDPAILDRWRATVAELRPDGHAELLAFGVADLAPQGPAALAQPSIELLEAAPFTGLRIDPNTPAAVLHILLDDALLPAAGDASRNQRQTGSART